MSRSANWRLSTSNSPSNSPKRSVTLINKGLTAVPEFWKDDINIEKVRISNNPIKTISNIPILKKLTELHMDYTEISSLEGVSQLPALKTITFFETPLYDCQFSRIMCRIVFPKVLYVNNIKVSQKEKEFVNKRKDELINYILKGFILLALDPIKLIHPQTRKRKTIYSNLRIMFNGKNLTKIPEIQDKFNVTSLDLSNNAISDLQNLPTMPILKELVLDNTNFSSLMGLLNQPCLEKLSILNTPFAKNKYFMEMLLVMFPSLLEVNGIEITPEMREFCQKNYDIIREKLLLGYILMNKDPLMFSTITEEEMLNNQNRHPSDKKSSSKKQRSHHHRKPDQTGSELDSADINKNEMRFEKKPKRKRRVKKKTAQNSEQYNFEKESNVNHGNRDESNNDSNSKSKNKIKNGHEYDYEDEDGNKSKNKQSGKSKKHKSSPDEIKNSYQKNKDSLNSSERSIQDESQYDINDFDLPKSGDENDDPYDPDLEFDSSDSIEIDTRNQFVKHRSIKAKYDSSYSSSYSLDDDNKRRFIEWSRTLTNSSRRFDNRFQFDESDDSSSQPISPRVKEIKPPQKIVPKQTRKKRDEFDDDFESYSD